MSKIKHTIQWYVTFKVLNGNGHDRRFIVIAYDKAEAEEKARFCMEEHSGFKPEEYALELIEKIDGYEVDSSGILVALRRS